MRQTSGRRFHTLAPHKCFQKCSFRRTTFLEPPDCNLLEWRTLTPVSAGRAVYSRTNLLFLCILTKISTRHWFFFSWREECVPIFPSSVISPSHLLNLEKKNQSDDLKIKDWFPNSQNLRRQKIASPESLFTNLNTTKLSKEAQWIPLVEIGDDFQVWSNYNAMVFYIFTSPLPRSISCVSHLDFLAYIVLHYRRY